MPLKGLNESNPEQMALSRDLDGAREAYETKDVAASKAAHDGTGGTTSSPERHGQEGAEFVKSIIYGGLDGIVTTFAVVAASVGANLDLSILLLMGWASLIADGISMGFGDFLSSKAEHNYEMKERERESWELENYEEGEKREMVELYCKKGLTAEHATAVIDIFAKYPELFLDLMMVEELGMLPPDPDKKNWQSGLVTFLSFLTFGSVPLWFYVVFYIAGMDNYNVMFAVDCVATILTLFLLGVFKARLTQENAFKSGVNMMLNGSIAALAAYFTGWGLEVAFDI